MHGTPVSFAEWRRINAIGALMLFITAALAVVLIKTWAHRRAQPLLLAMCWIITVGCVSHALIDIIERIASLAGAITIPLPFWRTIDRRSADLEDLLFNEPWFFVEGVLWAAVAWAGALHASRRRRWWVGGALVATSVATTVGVLTAFGVIDRVIVG